MDIILYIVSNGVVCVCCKMTEVVKVQHCIHNLCDVHLFAYLKPDLNSPYSFTYIIVDTCICLIYLAYKERT